MRWKEVYGAQDDTVQTEDISGTVVTSPSGEWERIISDGEDDVIVTKSEFVPIEDDDIAYGNNSGFKYKMQLQEQENMTEDKITVLLEQRKSFTDIPAYEIVGLDRGDVTIVQEEVDKSNQYGGEPFRDGVYYVEVDSLTEIFDGYDGSFIVSGDTSFGEEMYGASQHDYEIEIFNARST